MDLRRKFQVEILPLYYLCKVSNCAWLIITRKRGFNVEKAQSHRSRYLPQKGALPVYVSAEGSLAWGVEWMSCPTALWKIHLPTFAPLWFFVFVFWAPDSVSLIWDFSLCSYSRPDSQQPGHSMGGLWVLSLDSGCSFWKAPFLSYCMLHSTLQFVDHFLHLSLCH